MSENNPNWRVGLSRGDVRSRASRKPVSAMNGSPRMNEPQDFSVAHTRRNHAGSGRFQCSANSPRESQPATNIRSDCTIGAYNSRFKNNFGNGSMERGEDTSIETGTSFWSGQSDGNHSANRWPGGRRKINADSRSDDMPSVSGRNSARCTRSSPRRNILVPSQGDTSSRLVAEDSINVWPSTFDNRNYQKVTGVNRAPNGVGDSAVEGASDISASHGNSRHGFISSDNSRVSSLLQQDNVQGHQRSAQQPSTSLNVHAEVFTPTAATIAVLSNSSGSVRFPVKQCFTSSESAAGSSKNSLVESPHNKSRHKSPQTKPREDVYPDAPALMNENSATSSVENIAYRLHANTNHRLTRQYQLRTRQNGQQSVGHDQQSFRYRTSERILNNVAKPTSIAVGGSHAFDSNEASSRDYRTSGQEVFRRNFSDHGTGLVNTARSEKSRSSQSPRVAPQESKAQKESIEEHLWAGDYDCVICCLRVRNNHPVWNCPSCFHMFHLRCIAEWAHASSASSNTSNDSSTAVTKWRCPACQYVNNKLTFNYVCFCGKLRDPPVSKSLVPHSCGQLCQKVLAISDKDGDAKSVTTAETSSSARNDGITTEYATINSKSLCVHRCNKLCHPGRCPPCDAIVQRKCACGRTSQQVRCDNRRTQVLRCSGSQCGRILACGRHVCNLTSCHAANECRLCTEERIIFCICEKSSKRVSCASAAFEFLCNEPCGKLLKCGRHHCTRICHRRFSSLPSADNSREQKELSKNAVDKQDEGVASIESVDCDHSNISVVKIEAKALCKTENTEDNSLMSQSQLLQVSLTESLDQKAIPVNNEEIEASFTKGTELSETEASAVVTRIACVRIGSQEDLDKCMTLTRVNQPVLTRVNQPVDNQNVEHKDACQVQTGAISISVPQEYGASETGPKTATAYGDSCEPCPFANVMSCPCGRVPLPADWNCLMPVPLCDSPCGRKRTSCEHSCEATCHLGKCPPCSVIVRGKRCRCGTFVDEAECGLTEVVCKRRCNKKKNCGRHKCLDECCNKEFHICELICGKKLTCGLHTCKLLCHKGPCPKCDNVSFDELSCHCGYSVIYPPIACNMSPPECSQLCARAHRCHHPVTHPCHSEATCPPCTVLTEKRCHGGHELRRNIPCYLENVSCGKPCGQLLPCGRHQCNKTCHAGDCPSTCEQPCRVKRECGHPCKLPCHEVCPRSLCFAQVEVSCGCGYVVEKRTCHEFRFAAISMVRQKLRHDDVTLKTDLLQYAKGFLKCVERCALEERNRKLAEALQIPPQAPPTFISVLYSDYVKEEARRNWNFASRVVSKLNELVELAKNSPQASKSFSFDPMPRDQRRFIHELVEVYRCDSQSYDREPKRNVVVTAYRARSVIPTVSLASAIGIVIALPLNRKL